MPSISIKTANYLLILLAFLFYGNSLLNEYSFDDEYVITNNKKVQQGFAGIPEIFKTRYIETGDQNFGYRPVTLATFAIEYGIFGENAFVSHLFNLLLYLGICLLLFKLLRSLFKNHHWLLAFCVSVLFLVHPIHSEVVNNVKCRDELLCLLFALLALWAGIKFIVNNKNGWLLAVLGCMVLSILSKLSSLTFLVLLPLTLYFFKNTNWKQLLKLFGVMLLPLLLFRTINTQLIEASGNRSTLFVENPLFVIETSFFERLPMAFYTLTYYLKLLVFPHPLISYYGYDHVDIVGWENPLVYVGLAISIIALIFIFLKWKSKSPFIFGILFFFISISMFTNLVKPAVGIIAERFMFIPSVGFCIVVGALLFKLLKLPISEGKKASSPKLNYTFLGIFGLIALASLAKTFTRNQDWKDLTTLLKNDLEIAPKSVKMNMLYADELFEQATRKNEKDPSRKSLLATAETHYLQAIETFPDHTPAHNNLGALYNTTGDLKKSEYHFSEAISSEMPTAKSYFNYGVALQLNGNSEAALKNFKKAIEIDPNHFKSYENIMGVHFSKERYEKALQTNIEMFRKFPQQRTSIFSKGQQIAEVFKGKKTTYYIDELLTEKLISPQRHQALQKQLSQ